MMLHHCPPLKPPISLTNSTLHVLSPMDLHLLVSPPLHSIIIVIFFILILVPLSYSQDNEQYMNCTQPYQCGNINVGYPFWGDNRPNFCGHEGFELSCVNNSYPVIDIAGMKFRVLEINQSLYMMTIARMDLWDNVCAAESFSNTTFNYNLFNYSSTNQDLYLFSNCSSEVQIPVPYINCSINGAVSDTIYYVNDSQLAIHQQQLEECKKPIMVPVLNSNLDQLWNQSLTLQDTLDRGFDAEYDSIGMQCGPCESSNGYCLYNSTFLCLCGDTTEPQYCPKSVAGNGMKSWKWKLRRLGIGVATAAVGMLFMCIIICCFRIKTSSLTSIAFFWKITKNDQYLEAFIRSYGTLALKRHSFSSIEKMTNSFKDKLGQGGYGGVYRGKLLDGRLVAVKVLNESKGNGEEFINEVASISRTSHVNIVTLLGFCLEGCKRALIYEFMPNGSLEKFICNDNTLKASQHLGWEKLYQIAIGTARGLEYLHRGCNTRILHFDIKPHNILLDKDFCPKISDFGLAKLCSRNESIISMLGTRGTIGYMAPEVFSRIFGGVSHKSDVYSFGMMVLEMVGGSKNISVEVNQSSEICFPHWVHKRLELGTEFEWHGVTTDEETEIVKKMILVGMWCIQTNPSDRPSMSKVIEMLEGSIEALVIPPRPFPSSPPRSPPSKSTSDSFTTSMSYVSI